MKLDQMHTVVARIKYLLVGLTIGIMVLLLPGCSMNATSQNRRTLLADKAVILKDANGTVLGYVTETTAESVTVFTPKQYFVSLGWDGVLTDGTCWYAGTKGTGTMFYIAPTTEKLVGFPISINGQAYVAAVVDASGFAVSDPSITGFQSYYSGNGTVADATGVVPTGHVAYSLKPASLEDIGIPASIATPRELVFQ